jgi:hypothetical protein
MDPDYSTKDSWVTYVVYGSTAFVGLAALLCMVGKALWLAVPQ